MLRSSFSQSSCHHPSIHNYKYQEELVTQVLQIQGGFDKSPYIKACRNVSSEVHFSTRQQKRIGENL